MSVGQLQLSQDCGGVCLHCAGGHGEPRPDLFVRVSGGDETQHVPLAPGELVELSVEAGRRPAGEGVQREAGEAGGE